MTLYTTTTGVLSMYIGCHQISSAMERSLSGLRYYPCWGVSGGYHFLWFIFGLPEEFVAQYVNLPDAFELFWDRRYDCATRDAFAILICKEELLSHPNAREALYGFGTVTDTESKSRDDRRRTLMAGRKFAKRVEIVPYKPGSKSARARLDSEGRKVPGAAWEIDLY